MGVRGSCLPRIASYFDEIIMEVKKKVEGLSAIVVYFQGCEPYMVTAITNKKREIPLKSILGEDRYKELLDTVAVLSALDYLPSQVSGTRIEVEVVL